MYLKTFEGGGGNAWDNESSFFCLLLNEGASLYET